MMEHMDEYMNPALLTGEARVFALAAIRMIEHGELEQAAILFRRAAEFAQEAA